MAMAVATAVATAVASITYDYTTHWEYRHRARPSSSCSHATRPQWSPKRFPARTSAVHIYAIATPCLLLDPLPFARLELHGNRPSMRCEESKYQFSPSPLPVRMPSPLPVRCDRKPVSALRPSLPTISSLLDAARPLTPAICRRVGC